MKTPKLLFVLVILLHLMIAAPALADEQADAGKIDCSLPANKDTEVCPKKAAADLSKVTLENPLGTNVNSLSQIYGKVIYAFLGMSGVIALIMFIYGGFHWMTAGGNEEKVKKGRDTLLWAALGLVVIFSSYAILRTIFESLQF